MTNDEFLQLQLLDVGICYPQMKADIRKHKQEIEDRLEEQHIYGECSCADCMEDYAADEGDRQYQAMKEGDW